jgi:uncharacterized lipoprotein YbaY/uncharacterized lipoprotein NlpE involved in copper resistance
MKNPLPANSRPVLHRSLARFLGFVLLAAAAPCQSLRAEPAVVGEAAFRERIAVPPDARFEAVLEDVSLADAPAEVLGTATLKPPGNPPYRFEIPYDPARIQPSHRYGVRAQLSAGGRLWFTTDRMYPVLTGGAGDTVSLLLRKVGGPAPAQPGVGGPLGGLPAGYEGILPCADCPGIRFLLDLYPDGFFVRRFEYLERNVARDEIGRWSLSLDRKTLVLQGGEGDAQSFAVRDGLPQPLDSKGRPVQAGPAGKLKRRGLFLPLEPRLKMQGDFRYLADAGSFTECGSGRRFPVAQEGDNAALESAYRVAAKEPGAPVTVAVLGRIVQRPKVDSGGMEPALAVERFIETLPGPGCTPGK